MWKLVKLLVLNLIFSGSVFAQVNYYNNSDNFSPHVIFVEAGGNGLGLSMNYEWLASQNLGIRMGVGNYILGATFPVLVNLYYGGNNKLELGAGLTFLKGETKEFFGEATPLVISSTVGLRHQKPNGGIVIRINVTPFFNPTNTRVKFFGGISIGYAFH